MAETENKEKLLEIMERLLVILRNVLSTITQERRAHEEDNFQALRGISDERLNLFAAYERWSQVCITTLQTIAGQEHEEKLRTLEGCLEHITDFIEADDVDLHLLQEQMVGMMAEIHEQSQSLLDFLEHKSVPPTAFHEYFREIRPAKPKIGVAVMEEDEPEDSEVKF